VCLSENDGWPVAVTVKSRLSTELLQNLRPSCLTERFLLEKTIVLEAGFVPVEAAALRTVLLASINTTTTFVGSSNRPSFVRFSPLSKQLSLFGSPFLSKKKTQSIIYHRHTAKSSSRNKPFCCESSGVSHSSLLYQ
jgi:hypothetical protein